MTRNWTGRWLLAILLIFGSTSWLEAAEARPRILLTNDDGIQAPGLAALYTELARLGEVTVAAPAENQSGVGHGITFAEPIFVRAIPPLVESEGSQGPWYRIAARPATCVRLALEALLPAKPDLVVSGINRGANLGRSVYVSGTVAAAREAAADGIPALAASVSESAEEFTPAAKATAQIAAQLLAHRLPEGIFLSLNIPAGPSQGLRIVPHAPLEGRRSFERRESPYGQAYYWSLWEPPQDSSLATDVGAFAQGFVTLTPLRVDANDPQALATLSEGKLSLPAAGDEKESLR